LRLNQNEFGFGPPRTLTVFGVQVPAHPKFNTVITAPQFRTGPPQQFAPETPLRARTL